MLEFTDFIYMVKYKLSDTFLKFFWKLQLGRLGYGSLLRSKTRVIGNPKRIKIGRHFKVYENCIFAIGKGEIIIGNNGLLGVGTYINVGNEKLSIGDGVAIAPYCKLFTYSHHYTSDQKIVNTYKTGDITIEDDVLLGANTTVLPGVRIGKSAVVAAGSIVIQDIPANTIYGGTPAKFIKLRSSEGTGNL